jgi:hypothetical protein
MLQRYERCGHTMLQGALQSVGIGAVADDQDDLDVAEVTCLLRVQQRLQVRAAAGNQHSDAIWLP